MQQHFENSQAAGVSPIDQITHSSSSPLPVDSQVLQSLHMGSSPTVSHSQRPTPVQSVRHHSSGFHPSRDDPRVSKFDTKFDSSPTTRTPLCCTQLPYRQDFIRASRGNYRMLSGDHPVNPHVSSHFSTKQPIRHSFIANHPQTEYRHHSFVAGHQVENQRDSAPHDRSNFYSDQNEVTGLREKNQELEARLAAMYKNQELEARLAAMSSSGHCQPMVNNTTTTSCQHPWVIYEDIDYLDDYDHHHCNINVLSQHPSVIHENKDYFEAYRKGGQSHHNSVHLVLWDFDVECTSVGGGSYHSVANDSFLSEGGGIRVMPGPATRTVGVNTPQDYPPQFLNLKLEPFAPIVIKDNVKFTLPIFDIKTWPEFGIKMHAASCKGNISYLLKESETRSKNAVRSKVLCLELYDKLQGSALQLFTSMANEQYYMEGGRGIEMLRILAQTFNPMDQQAVSKLINNMQLLTLSNDMDHCVFISTLEDTNMQMGWAGQAMSDMYLVTHAMTRLKTSRYKDDIVALQLSQTANGSYFQNIAELTYGFYRLDSLRGLPYGGAAQNSSIVLLYFIKTPGLELLNSTKNMLVSSVRHSNVLFADLTPILLLIVLQ